MNARAAGQYVPPVTAVAQPVAAAPVAAMSPEVAAARALLEAQGLA
jgi:hypothetical protein